MGEEGENDEKRKKRWRIKQMNRMKIRRRKIRNYGKEEELTKKENVK